MKNNYDKKKAKNERWRNEEDGGREWSEYNEESDWREEWSQPAQSNESHLNFSLSLSIFLSTNGFNVQALQRSDL